MKIEYVKQKIFSSTHTYIGIYCMYLHMCIIFMLLRRVNFSLKWILFSRENFGRETFTPKN